MAVEKPITTVVLDTGPIIRNHPSVSSLIAQSEELVTVPSIISEIRDAATRSRVETTLVPFLKLRTPNENSLKFVSDFARKTGDAAVLSRVDLQIAALAYEIECERNGGDWRLRRVPGQKRVNGSPPKPADAALSGDNNASTEVKAGESGVIDAAVPSQSLADSDLPVESTGEEDHLKQPDEPALPQTTPARQTLDETIQSLEDASISHGESPATKEAQDKVDSAHITPEDSPSEESASASDTDSGGEWITPSNLKRKQALDSNATTTSTAPTKMQVATLTTDNALQNLLLQINLNLLSPSLSRITHLRTTVLRCHACFLVHKQPDIQFCQRCGKPALTRVTATTQANGEVKIHLKRNMQWNNRGAVYSIPKPVHGSANGRVKGGGKNGWGNGLVLAPDQKEYVRAEEERAREERKGRALMDEDYLPGILTGRREGRNGGRTKVGAGKNVNSRKR